MFKVEGAMTLSEKQRLFGKYFNMLLTWLLANGYEYIIEEVKRTQAQAEANAASGAGILHSLHLIKLAADLSIFKDNHLLQTVEQYKPIGDYWKSLNPLCCWGGDFHKPDADHFSLTHEGIK